MPPPAPPPPPPAPPPGGPRDGPVKIVPLLGDALHEMKKKLTGFEETPAASEGVSVSNGVPKLSSARKDKPRQKTYGSQVPGKPNRDNAFLSEIQNKLSKRRDKVDAESYVVETPDHLVVESLPPSGRGGDGDYSPGSSHRRMSKDSGRCSLTPSVDGDTRRVSVDYSHYRRVSVDMDRKEELALAKAVRKSSVKIRRSSPSMWDSGDTTPRNESSPETVPAPGNLPPPSPVVMRYWKQCAGAEDDQEDGEDEASRDQGAEPSWKDDALEGEVQEFPSIRDKISNMEQVGKTIGQFTVSDVKSRVKTDSTPAAGWMEARSKLQTQLDSLIAKTSAKISKYGTVHAVEPREVVRERTPEEEVVKVDMEEKKKMISPAISNLIKSVASEIQKSFSSKNLASSENGDDEESCDENNNNTNEDYWRNQNEIKHKQPKIDMEAPIDFDYNEPETEEVKEDEPIVEELEVVSTKETEEPTQKTSEVPAVVGKKQKKREPEVKMSETLLACLEEDRKKEGKAEKEEEDEDEFTTEGPVSFDKMPGVLESSAARSKATLMRKTSTERRLPASVLAKKKMAAKQNSVMQQIQKELIDASFQVNMSNTAEDLENMSDEDKVDLIAKQISKMESGYIMKLLKQLETGILDISVPMLMPFLSLQVRLDLGTNIFRNLEPENKAKMVKENIIQDMLSDITDIALLQEVIDRTQEKINFLSAPTVINMDNYYSLEDDSFDLPSPGPRCFTPPPAVDVPVLTSVLSHLDKLMKEGSKKASEAKEEQKKSESQNTENKSTPAEVKPSNTKENVDEKSDESDEGLPSSDCDSSSEDDKEAEKISVVEKEKTPEKITVKERTPEKVTVKEKTPEKIPEEKENNSKSPADEGIIKQKLRNILDNCKTNDKQRPVREFGRNFEFQGMAQRPVVPNDRRPVKAKRLDDMWMSTMAKKDKWSCNTLPPTTSKPKVPWTMNKNTQPKKKEEEEMAENEVKQFNNCQKNLKAAETKAVETVKKTVASVEKKETENKVESKTNVSNVKKEEILREKSPVIVSKPENTEEEDQKSVEKKEGKPIKEEVKSRQPKIDMEAPIDFDEVKKPDPRVVDSLKPPREEPKKTIETLMEPEKESAQAPEPAAVSEPPAVLGTPTVRRRGDTFTVVIPLARGPAPPPPCSRPPPPPMSPPVTAARIVEMEKEENKVVGKVEKVESEESEEESEYESEYEWTEESESEEEGETYEVNKEGWENIMSSAKGPTTFNADYSIRVTGK